MIIVDLITYNHYQIAHGDHGFNLWEYSPPECPGMGDSDYGKKRLLATLEDEHIEDGILWRVQNDTGPSRTFLTRNFSMLFLDADMKIWCCDDFLMLENFEKIESICRWILYMGHEDTWPEIRSGEVDYCVSNYREAVEAIEEYGLPYHVIIARPLDNDLDEELLIELSMELSNEKSVQRPTIEIRNPIIEVERL